MLRRRNLVTLVAMITVMTTAAAACTRGNSSPPTSAVGTGPSVGLLLEIPGRGDRSFNDAAAAALDRAAQQLDIRATEATPTTDGDRDARVRDLVESGTELIIAVGPLWRQAISAASAQHSETNFVIIDDVVDAPNVASILFAHEQGAFLMGAAAALTSATGTVGFIAGVEDSPFRELQAGFLAGVNAVNADTRVLVQYLSQPPDLSGLSDPVKSAEIATAMYAQGADVIFSAPEAVGLGVFEAVRTVPDPARRWVIGVDSDQYLLASPEVQPYILTSMVKQVESAVFDVISTFVTSGSVTGVRRYDLAVGGIGYSISGGFVRTITSDLDAYAARLVSGEIVIPGTP